MNEILAQAIRRGYRSRIPIKQTPAPVSVPVKVVEKKEPELSRRDKLIILIAEHERRIAALYREADATPQERLPAFISVGTIIRTVAAHYRLRLSDMISVRRTVNVVLPRQVAMYLARTMTPRSYPEIGRMMGGRDHTTVLHGHDKIKAMLETNADLRETVEQIKQKLGSACPPVESSAPAVPQAVGAS